MENESAWGHFRLLTTIRTGTGIQRPKFLQNEKEQQVKA